MKDEQVKVFESDNLWASIFKMVVPALIAILVMLIYNMADMIFVGQTGETAQVAAISVVGPIFNLIMAVAMLISAGATVIISSDLGKKDNEHAKMVSSLCIWSGIICGIIAGALIIVFNKPILVFLGATQDIIGYARNYMLILAVGAPLLLISNMLGQVLRAEGAVKDGLIGNLIGTVINIILDPIFILGLGMGVVGAAIATVLGNLVATFYYIRYMKKKAVVLNMKLSYARMNPVFIFSVMALGLPNAISTLLSGFANSFANQLLSKYGSDAIAANAAAGRVNMIITMILMGICMGAQPLMSYNYGAGRLDKLSGVIKRLLIMSTSFGLITAGVVIFFKSAVISLFLKDAEVAVLAENILTILMISSPFLGFFYLATNFLQATGNALKATIISALQKGLLLIPLLFILEYLFGFMGIRCAYVAADFGAIIISCILLVIEWMKISDRAKKEYEKEEMKNGTNYDGCAKRA
ncbi:MAG: MATE family efflux transporter [Butyrivibrio sp.]|nr:MATE family efflux transporter [Butyrivibrio sp.]